MKDDNDSERSGPVTPGCIKTFLIGPVRGLPADHLRSIVDDLVTQGYSVYWPARDTDQADETGLGICRMNFQAIFRADVVHVVWDGKSQGCLFDIGMAFALGKRIIPIELPEATEGKSFQNMIRELDRQESVARKLSSVAQEASILV